MIVRPPHWIRLLVLMAAWVMARAQTPPAPVITEYRLPPGKLAKSEALYRTRMILSVAGTVYAPAVLTLLLVLRIGARYRDWAERASRRPFVQALVFAPLLVLTIDVLSLPLGLYGQSLQRSYGLSVQSWASWWSDWIKGELLTIPAAILLAWGISWMLRRSPRRWWLFGWLVSIPLMLLMVWGQPVFIDPLFNHFEPLEAKQPRLIPEIEKVLRRGGLTIERSRMFEMRASDKVTTDNAYVTGIGASKRVVVWDNTSKDLTIPETLYVFAHEQGHYVLHHIWLGIGLSIAGLLAAFYLAYRIAGGILARAAGRFGVRGLSDWASLPFLLLLAHLLTLAGQPVGLAVSRSIEHQADIYALEAIHGLVPDSGQVAAACEQKLGEKALAYPTPHPLYVAWFYTHPPIGERLRFALEYQPWNSGQPLRYLP
jgi:STE24 endopeptidase